MCSVRPAARIFNTGALTRYPSFFFASETAAGLSSSFGALFIFASKICENLRRRLGSGGSVLSGSLSILRCLRCRQIKKITKNALATMATIIAAISPDVNEDLLLINGCTPGGNVGAGVVLDIDVAWVGVVLVRVTVLNVVVCEVVRGVEVVCVTIGVVVVNTALTYTAWK